MKRHSANIVISVLMSVLLVWMGSGILMIHCCHTEKSTIVSLNEACKDKCAPISDCMKAKVVTLSPVYKAFTNSFVFQAPAFTLAIFNLPQLSEFNLNLNSLIERITPRWFEHPRAYLSFIRILRI